MNTTSSDGAEVTALELAAEIALTSPPSLTKGVIYPDSQAAIRGVNSPDKQSGQAILISAIQKLQSPTIVVVYGFIL
jgi:hypothetical protein